MHRPAHSRPGTQPAMSRVATEVPPQAAEKMMKALVGGISWPTGAVAMLVAAENSSS